MTLQLHGLGHFHPATEITNAFLEELDIGTSEPWILERVGIRSRRTVLPLDYIRATRNADLRASQEAASWSNAELAAEAGRMALARAALGAERIGLVVSGSCAPDALTPAEACTVAAALGIEAPAFDLNSACTSFLAQLDLLSRVATGLPDFVLAVAVDSLTKVTSYDDRASAVLFGDAAVAAVLSPRIPGRAQVLGSCLQSSPAGHAKVRVPRASHFSQEGRTVQAFAIRKSVEALKRLRADCCDPWRALHFVGHQANLRVLEAVCLRAGVGPERHHANVELFGNTGAPSGPSVVSQAWDKWTPRDDVALVGVGGGLSWARALLRFGEAVT